MIWLRFPNRESLFFSRKPEASYVTVPAKWTITNSLKIVQIDDKNQLLCYTYALSLSSCCRVFPFKVVLTVGDINVLLIWQSVDWRHEKCLWSLKRRANSFIKIKLLPASVCLKDSSSRQEMIPGKNKKNSNHNNFIIIIPRGSWSVADDRNNCRPRRLPLCLSSIMSHMTPLLKYSIAVHSMPSFKYSCCSDLSVKSRNSFCNFSLQ